MSGFYQGCEVCSGFGNRACFECVGVRPYLCGDVHCLGQYFCRVMPEHHRSAWSKGILKLKQGVGTVISALGRMTAFYLEEAFSGMKPYVLTNVPMWTACENQRMFPKADFGVTRRLALSVLSSMKGKGVEYEQLLSLTGKKQKRQRECKTFAERQRNIAEAYDVVNEREIVGADVVLLDDVLTTGSTLEACVSVLRHAGANAVVPVVLARTVRKQHGDCRQQELLFSGAGWSSGQVAATGT